MLSRIVCTLHNLSIHVWCGCWYSKLGFIKLEKSCLMTPTKKMFIDALILLSPWRTCINNWTRGSGQWMSFTVLICCLCSHNFIYCSIIYYFFNVYSGDESKVPNMQDVVRKLLNALHHSVMNHVVRYFF